MNVLIHDIKEPAEEAFLKVDPNNATVISDSGKIHPCICCFGCWIKTPGQCVINDGYNTMGALISKCDQLIIVSRCFYGSYSPFVHNVLDRSISYLLPYFRTKDGETHHKNRYDHTIAFAVYFYGKVSDREKETARKLVAANGVNFFAQKTETYFYDTVEDLPEALV
jgi:multimeric flavodoxin WrbA